MPNYIAAGFKTKVEAISSMLNMLIANPATAGLDGKLNVIIWGQLMILTPVKKSKNE